MKLIAFTISCFLLFVNSASAAGLSIAWEVIQPFKLLKYQSDHKIHEWAIAEILKIPSAKTVVVSEMELRLNNPKWWNTRPPGGDKTYKELLEELRAAENAAFSREIVKFDPRLGWGSMLRNSEKDSISSGTCWNARRKDFKDCVSDASGIKGGDNYIFPKVHLVRIKGTHSGGGGFDGECTLRVADGELNPGFGFLDKTDPNGPERAELGLAKCSEGATLRIEYGKTYGIEMTAAGETLRENVGVADLLIAGIGDSFAAGEGNPELPAALDPSRGIRPYTKVTTGNITDETYNFMIPVRKLQRNRSELSFAADTHAKWFDQQCHRSVYGPQFRAAMAMALYGRRHHAVTFVSYACSGAEITDGLFWPQDHRECTDGSQAGRRMHQPQLSGLVRSLSGSDAEQQFPVSLAPGDRFRTTREYTDKRGKCATWQRLSPNVSRSVLVKGKLKRKIDLLLVGVGGNDIGFSPLVSKIVINSGLLEHPVPFFSDAAIYLYQQLAGAISVDEAKRRIDRLDLRYKALAAAIKTKLEIDDPGRVLVNEYPGFARDQNRQFCGGGNKGMNVSKLLSVLGRRTSPSKVLPVDGDAIRVSLNSKLRRYARDNGYVYVPIPTDASGDVFAKHGFCATSATPTAPTAEIFDLPHGRTAWEKVDNIKYDPTSDFYPYASRQRWVRTFNDAYLLSFYFKDNPTNALFIEKRNASYLAARSLGGPMHPTAEGYAHMADGIFNAGVKVLFDNSGEPKK